MFSSRALFFQQAYDFAFAQGAALLREYAEAGDDCSLDVLEESIFDAMRANSRYSKYEQMCESMASKAAEKSFKTYGNDYNNILVEAKRVAKADSIVCAL